MNILALATDAFGGRGGIAQFNRDLLNALATDKDDVTAIPRIVIDPPSGVPTKIRYITRGANSKARYVATVFAEARKQRYAIILCAHLHLLPLAALIAWWHGARLVAVIYGIEAWTPPRGVVRRSVRRVDLFVAISEFTRNKFLAWARFPEDRVRVIPCAVDIARFQPGPKRKDLIDRYSLGGRRVILTLARLAGEERYKGFDEVLEVLPDLLKAIPNLVYLIVGDGPDKERLIAKTQDLAIADRVVFCGYVSEVDKPDYYRLADLFVMAGRGEGFGIVYLEAMACGIPVIASTLDASRETVRNGVWGIVVNPDDPAELVRAIEHGLATTTPYVPAELETLSVQANSERWRDLITELSESR